MHLIEVGSPQRVLYRLGHAPDPLELPPKKALRRAGQGRFDDPYRKFRVLYAAETQLSCFLEVLAYYRPKVRLAAKFEAMRDDAPVRLQGVVPPAVLIERRIGTFNLRRRPAQRFLDLRQLATREYLRAALAPAARRLRLDDFDASDALGRNRTMTQAVARWAHENGFNGVVYLSRYEPKLTNWALFEPLKIQDVDVSVVKPDNPELRQALELFGLSLP